MQRIKRREEEEAKKAFEEYEKRNKDLLNNEDEGDRQMELSALKPLYFVPLPLGSRMFGPVEHT